MERAKNVNRQPVKGHISLLRRIVPPCGAGFGWWGGQSSARRATVLRRSFPRQCSTAGNPDSGRYPAFRGLPIQYLTKSLRFMIPPLKSCLFLRMLSLFAASQLKRLSMNHLHQKLSFFNQA
jgi:hypothetical protein